MGCSFFQIHTGQSDLERARKSFQRVSQMAGSNQYLDADLDLANRAATGAPVNNLTYVVLETGSAPLSKRNKDRYPSIPGVWGRALCWGSIPAIGL